MVGEFSLQDRHQANLRGEAVIEATRVEVVNMDYADYDVRIDRRTPRGNPFKIDRNTSRSEVIEKYGRWTEKRPHLVTSLVAEVAEKSGVGA